MWGRFAISWLVVFASPAGSALFAEQPAAARTSKTRNVLIVAHRGLLRHVPENTAAAFRSCLNLRMGFELDVQRTRDGKLVCVHDATLDRTTDGKGRVSDRTWAELQTLDAGAWFNPVYRGERIPSVDETFAMLAQFRHRSILVAVDLKITDPTVERDLVALAKKYRVLNRLLFIGRTIESPATRKRLKSADTNTRTASLAKSRLDLSAILRDKNADWVYLRFIPTAADVRRMHAAKKRVILVGSKVAGSEPANWKSGVGNGVDAILTDYPLQLRRVISAK